MIPRKKILIQITSLGVPGFAMQLANSLLNLVLNKTLFHYGGDIAVSGMGIVNSIQDDFLNASYWTKPRRATYY